MKRLTLILMAGLLMLGMTQCKKEQTNANANAEGEWVNITVKVDAGDRHIVYPATGAVVYSDGDVIYVGNDGKYVGQLTYTNGVFSGDIYDPKDTDYLHFYFVGGSTPSVTPVTEENGTATTSFTVNIIDQSSKLPVLSYGHSTNRYTNGNAIYSCTLQNQCALVKFPLNCSGTGNGGTNLVVTVDGMCNVATVDFATASAGITATGASGRIQLYPESKTVKWAILLPQDAVASTTAHIGLSTYNVTNVPAIYNNGYDNSSVEIVYNAAAVDPVFTVGSKTKVRFSPGNLQATTSDLGEHWTWSFADHQYDYVGGRSNNGSEPQTGNNFINGNGTLSANGTVDLFCWSTDKTIFGIHNSTTADDYKGDFVDWGTNAIYNPKTSSYDAAGTWRTLTGDSGGEWEYLFNSRNNASSKYSRATVCGVCGVVILPDKWTLPSGCSFTSGASNWTTNTYDESHWASMESQGAVFLPVAGYRTNGATVVSDPGRYGYYWSATPDGSTRAKNIYISLGAMDLDHQNVRYNAYSVRLVRNAN